MQKLVDRINAISQAVGQIASWLSLVLVLVVFADVVMRYLINTSFVFMQELEWHLYALIFLLGACYTLSRDGHVRVDILYQKMNEREKAWTNFLGTILFLVPGCILVIVTSIPWICASISVCEGSPDPGGIPMRFILKSALPIGFALLLMQGIALALKSYMVLFPLAPKEEQ